MRLVPLTAQGIENIRTRELSEEQLTTLRDEVNKYTTEGDLVSIARPNCPYYACKPPAMAVSRSSALRIASGALMWRAVVPAQRRFNTMAIKRLIDIQSYRGKRHRMGLPVRGEQRSLGRLIPYIAHGQKQAVRD